MGFGAKPHKNLPPMSGCGAPSPAKSVSPCGVRGEAPYIMIQISSILSVSRFLPESSLKRVIRSVTVRPVRSSPETSRMIFP